MNSEESKAFQEKVENCNSINETLDMVEKEGLILIVNKSKPSLNLMRPNIHSSQDNKILSLRDSKSNTELRDIVKKEILSQIEYLYFLIEFLEDDDYVIITKENYKKIFTDWETENPLILSEMKEKCMHFLNE